MSTINVLEVRYADANEGPWGEPRPVTSVTGPLHDWRPTLFTHHTDKRYAENRVVPYTRQERHAGSEMPENTPDGERSRDVLACFGGRLAIAYYDYAFGRWEEHSSGRNAPDWWTDLPDLGATGA